MRRNKHFPTILVWLFATCGGIGKIPKCPGTCGALLALMLWTIGRPHIFSPFAITLLFVGSILGWRAILHILRFTSEKDPPYIVIDEFLGQLLALICVPDTQIAEIGAFLLFRFFDIKKKGGIRSVDLLSKRSDTSLRMAAACIIGDDLLAGLYAGILVRILGFCMAFL